METLPDFSFDLSKIDYATVLSGAWWIFSRGGWILILGLVARVAVLKLWGMYVKEVQGHYAASITWVTLNIRVPKLTEQTPKAVENIFSHLSGLYSGTGNFADKYITGRTQEAFSCELVSRNGTIQFLVHTPTKFRDVIEASIYAQYPDAEVVQIPDYAVEVPTKYPDEVYDLWGTELTFMKPSAYPIRTYEAFEHKLPGSFKDPLASLLEFLGTLDPSEQAWLQFVLLPTSDDWQKESEEVVKKLSGIKGPPPKAGLLDQVLDAGLGFVMGSLKFAANLFTPSAAPAAPAKPEEKPQAAPGDRVAIEQIQLKASRPGFLCKIRLVYVAPKEKFNKGKIASGVIGAFRQYSSSNLNGFKAEPNSKVAAGYFNVAKTIALKQNALIKNYIKRSPGGGGKPYILNVEELATLWHFPMIDTKAPWITKSDFKRAEPPGVLPMREESSRDRLRKPMRKSVSEESAPKVAVAPTEDSHDDVPGNLPFA